jgi:hypothetical protein
LPLHDRTGSAAGRRTILDVVLVEDLEKVSAGAQKEVGWRNEQLLVNGRTNPSEARVTCEKKGVGAIVESDIFEQRREQGFATKRTMDASSLSMKRRSVGLLSSVSQS